MSARRIAVLLCLLAGAGAQPAAARVPVRVSTEVRPDTVLVGQSITLRWRTFLPKGSLLNFPTKPPDDSTAHWSSWETATVRDEKGGLQEHRLTARMQSFALGPVAVPGPAIRFRVPGEDVREGRFPTTTFFVGQTVPTSGAEPPLRNMKALVPPPWWALVPWLWIAIGLAVLAIAVWLYRRWQAARRRVRPSVQAAEVLDAPEVEARKRLAALVARGLPEAGRTLEHGTELADLLRRYVERRFETPRPGYTTGELVRHLGARGDVAPSDVAVLKGILEACDLTKFARRPYDVTRAHQAEQDAHRLIETWAAPPLVVPAAAPRAAHGAAR
jgi:hypothetical protein